MTDTNTRRSGEEQVIGFPKEAEGGRPVNGFWRMGRFRESTFCQPGNISRHMEAPYARGCANVHAFKCVVKVSAGPTVQVQGNLADEGASPPLRAPSGLLVVRSLDGGSHPPQADLSARNLHQKTGTTAHGSRRFGDRRIHGLQRPQPPRMNCKWGYHAFQKTNLVVRRSKLRKRPTKECVPLQLAQTVIKVWSMDFVHSRRSDVCVSSNSPVLMIASMSARAPWSASVHQNRTRCACWAARS